VFIVVQSVAHCGIMPDLRDRAVRIYESWNSADSGVFAEYKGVFVYTGRVGVDEEVGYFKSYALYTWLLGGEFQETAILFRSDNTMCILCPNDHVQQIQAQLPSQPEANSSAAPKIEISGWKSESDVNNWIQLNLYQYLDSIKQQSHDDQQRSALKLGVLSKEKHSGMFCDLCLDCVAAVGEKYSGIVENANEHIAKVMAIKDENEQSRVKRAALLTCAVYKNYLIPELETILDEEQKVSHEQLSTETEKRLVDPALVQVKKLKSSLCDTCYLPIIQSGTKFDLRPSAVSNSEKISGGCVIVSMGARYAYYCSNTSRTFLIDPSDEQEKCYQALMDAFDAALEQLKPGKLCCDVYNAAQESLRNSDETLVVKLTKNVGFLMGIEFRESVFLLNAKTTKKIEAGMVFNLSLGLQDLSDAKNGAYALLVADTVLVTDKQPEVLTVHVKKAFKSISYNLQDENDDEEQNDSETEAQKASKMEIRGRARALLEAEGERKKRATAANSSAGITAEELEIRRKHQEELGRKKLEEGRKRFENNEIGGDEERDEQVKTIDHYRAYSSPSKYPVSIRPRQMFVDMDAEVVFVPINGIPVPFHVSTIKSANKSDEGSHTYVRINFMVPQKLSGGVAIVKKSDGSIFPDEDKHFVKEITVRSANPQNLSDCVRKIKEIRKRFVTAEQEKREQESIVEQAALQLDRSGKVPYLSDVSMRPPVATGKNNSGVLEAHLNGFRYRPLRGSSPIEILYSNIKNAFFQEAGSEVIVILHFHLRSPVMVGKKKTLDIQFYMEVMESAVRLNDVKRRAHDQDELEEEHREREFRNRANKTFLKFSREVEERYALEFDAPYRQLGFQGAPRNSAVFLMPTVSCIIDLIEWPPFILNLSDVEIAHFERVHFQLKNFDLVFVFKGFETESSKQDAFTRISAIPMQELETLKKFLDEQQIKYYEGPANLNWNNTLKLIRSDLEAFYEDDGWEFLNMDAADDEEAGDGDDDEDSVEEGDAAFEVDEEELEDSEDSDSDEDYSDDDDEYSEEAMDELQGASDEGEAELDSEEEGMDWEELEHEARKSDLKKDVGGDEDRDVGKKRGRAAPPRQRRR